MGESKLTCLLCSERMRDGRATGSKFIVVDEPTDEVMAEVRSGWGICPQHGRQRGQQIGHHSTGWERLDGRLTRAEYKALRDLLTGEERKALILGWQGKQRIPEERCARWRSAH